MFNKKIKVFLSGSAVTALMLLVSLPANALVVNFQQAGNACFPRVFAQIDFFKMSNGGLRNDSTTPKSIVCSYNVSKENTIVPSVNRVSAYVNVDSLAAPMECTVQVRDTNSNALIDSVTTMVSAGATGLNFLGTLDTTGVYDEKHLYTQCKVPAQGRVFSIVGAYFDS